MFRCNHDWKMISETTTKSKFETALEAVKNASHDSVKIPHQMCHADRKHIQCFQCVKCGQFKRFVENI